jgi:hypothetical protein
MKSWKWCGKARDWYVVVEASGVLTPVPVQHVEIVEECDDVGLDAFIEILQDEFDACLQGTFILHHNCRNYAALYLLHRQGYLRLVQTTVETPPQEQVSQIISDAITRLLSANNASVPGLRLTVCVAGLEHATRVTVECSECEAQCRCRQY